jgi:hypothetical protein
MTKLTFRNIVLIWLAWVVIVIGFQAVGTARFAPVFPDRAQPWTTTFTELKTYQVGHPFLLEPFMNNQVAWDSEYYLGIAVGGYNDARIPHLTPFGTTTFDYHLLVANTQYYGESVSLAYAFFPFYPWMTALFAMPLSLLGMNAIATATLAGVIVSALGALLGMLALYDLTRDTLDHEGAMRAVFYLLIFPTGFFLVQVYTEGLFIGLAFACLAMVRRGGWYWIPAGLLGAAATLTRAVGVALIIPMAMTWFRTGDWLDIDMEWRQIYHWFRAPNRKTAISFGKMILAFAPLITYMVWKFSRLGFNFDYVESRYFGRGLLDFGAAFYNWSTAYQSMFKDVPERTAYFLTEFLGLGIGIAACIACIRRKPEIAWFSLAVLIISWGSGPTQGIQRYILAAPAVFYMLADWGKNPVFDRAWTILSTMLMGLLAILFAFNFWVA